MQRNSLTTSVVAGANPANVISAKGNGSGASGLANKSKIKGNGDGDDGGQQISHIGGAAGNLHYST